MAKIGSQKLYNTARAGNGPLLQFMLSCTENLAPYRDDKLREAVLENRDTESKNNVLLCLAKMPISIGTWAQHTLETRVIGHFDKSLDPAVMRERLDAGIRLYTVELDTKPPYDVQGFFSYSAALDDTETFTQRVLPICTRTSYNASREDDFAMYLANTMHERSWGDKTPPETAKLRKFVTALLRFGTEYGLHKVYPNLLSRCLMWKVDEVITELFDTRPGAHFLNDEQARIFARLSPEAKNRLLSKAPSEDEMDDDDDE